MYRLGHTGIALLVLAPLTYVLLEATKPVLAIVIGLGVLGVEPLPDSDFKLPFLRHRGVSHSLLAAATVGGILALCGWVAGTQICTGIASVFTDVGHLIITITASVQTVTSPETSNSIGGPLTQTAGIFDHAGTQLQTLDRRTLAALGFVIGAVGILVHLAGDIITVSGIQPLLPFSPRKISLSSLRANNSLANPGFLVLGLVAILLVAGATVPGAALGASNAPADLSFSPVEVVGAQSHQHGPQTDTPYRTSGGTPVHDTVHVGSSRNNTSRSQSPPHATAHATVALDATNTTARTITVSKASLPNGGYVAIHDGSYDEAGILHGNEITVSHYLSPGVHQNISLPVERGVPGSQNVSRLNWIHQNLSVIAYRETNGNHHYDFESSHGNHDDYYQTQAGDPVADTEQVVFKRNVNRAKQRAQPASASLTFTNQTVARVNGSPSLTVKRVTLQHGGFVVVHNADYLSPTRDPLTSAIGLSAYLAPGTHRNVTVTLRNGSVHRPQTVVAVPYLDTNHNQRFDYVASGGENDSAYIARQNGSAVIVNETARVRVPRSAQRSTSVEPTPTPRESATPAGPAATGNSSENVADEHNTGLLGGISMLYILSGVVVIGLIVVVIGSVWRRS